MSFVKLALPPGVYRNGTKYQSMGRWYEANLVRWSEGAMQPIGGWVRIQGSDGDIGLDSRICGLLVWRDADGVAHVAMGTKDAAYSLSGGAVTDITPSSFTAGEDDAFLASGYYDQGAYDQGLYGTGSEAVSALTEAQSWQFDTFGEKLVACAYSDGKLYSWDLNTANDLTQMSGSPTGCRGVVVTPERFIVALGAGSDGRAIAWADQESETTWTPASTNQAGDFLLQGEGEIVCGRRSQSETLIWTDEELFAMRYIGGTLVYSFALIGRGGIVGPHAVASAEGRFFWMGPRGFFTYDGNVKPIPCEISDDVFTNLTRVQRSKVAAVPVTEFHEVWFLYPAEGSVENNRVVAYNYMENHWSGPWELDRTVGVGRGALGYPVLADAQGAIYYHENGNEYYADLTRATAGLFMLLGNVVENDTVTIGSTVYTFKATPSSAYDVDIGTDGDASMQNLASAINVDLLGEIGTGAGADYGTGTAAHPDVYAFYEASSGVAYVYARVAGSSGNSISFSVSGSGSYVVVGATAGYLVNGSETALVPSAESGPIEIDKGDRVMTVRRYIPDELTVGDVDMTLYASLYPTATESSQVLTIGEISDARLTGRQVRIAISQDQTDWRFGVPRLEVIPRGRR